MSSQPQFSMIHQTSLRELNRKQAPASAVLVFACLCSYDFNREGKVWPAMRTIANWLECDLRKVVRAIEWLESHGIIKRHRREENRRANSYTLISRAFRWMGIQKRENVATDVIKNSSYRRQQKSKPKENNSFFRKQNSAAPRYRGSLKAIAKSVVEYCEAFYSGDSIPIDKPSYTQCKEWLDSYGGQHLGVSLLGAEPLLESLQT
jgi:hypothetical protein